MSLYSAVFSVLRTTTSEQMRSLLSRKLKAMQTLKAGWSYGDGVPVTDTAAQIAEHFVYIASLLKLDADVFPNLDGGCAVAFYSGEDSVEVSISDDGSRLGLRVERGVGFQYEDLIEPQEDVSSEDVYLQVVQLVQDDRWKLPVSFTSSTSIQENSDSEIQSLSIQQSQMIPTPLRTRAGGSQSLTLLVPALT